jgi:hypothetical protein
VQVGNYLLPFFLAGDVLLHVPEFDALPFVLIEAMAARLACVVTRHLASELSFLDEENVMYVDGPTCLSSRENWRIKSPPQASPGAGWELVKDRLSAGRLAESYEQLYRKVIENAAPDKRRHVWTTHASSLRTK